MKNCNLSGLIKRSRKQQGITQLELSDLCGVSATVIYKMESGRRDVTLESFLAVTQALGMSVRCHSPLGEEVDLSE